MRPLALDRPDPEAEQSDNNALKDNLIRIDAMKAECYYETDRQQLLSLIESSFGTTTYFNQSLRNLFTALWKTSDSAAAVAAAVQDQQRADARTSVDVVADGIATEVC